MFTLRRWIVVGAGLAAAACGGGSEQGGSADGPSNPPSGSNRPPILSGNPPAMVLVGNAYEFRPQASDPDGQSLTFSVTNKPMWLSFEPATGRLAGVPAAADVGTYAGIAISASDGLQSAALPPFSILVSIAATGTATVTWTPPRSNEDGSPITNLKGFRVHYGLSSTSLSQTVEIPDVAVTSATVDKLGSGTWYFGVTAYTTSGEESIVSGIASKTIN